MRTMVPPLKVFAGLAILASLFISSCKKDIETISSHGKLQSSSNTAQHRVADVTCGTTKTVNLIAGQYIQAGTVSVANTSTNLLVTYATANGWRIKELHLYVGDCAGIPVNNSGNPIPGHFPYSTTFSGTGVTTYTFTIPLASLPNCFCVAAHSVVSKPGAGTETAWGEGTRIVSKGNWAMKFDACAQPCGPIDEGCSFDPFRTFRDPNTAFLWTNPTVTVAGFNYTRLEGDAIFATPFSDGREAFLFAASIKESAGYVSPVATVWADVAIVEAWLVQFGKITPSNIPPNPPANVQASVDNINNWIGDGHDCDSIF